MASQLNTEVDIVAIAMPTPPPTMPEEFGVSPGISAARPNTRAVAAAVTSWVTCSRNAKKRMLHRAIAAIQSEIEKKIERSVRALRIPKSIQAKASLRLAIMSVLGVLPFAEMEFVIVDVLLGLLAGKASINYTVKLEVRNQRAIHPTRLKH